MNPELKEQIARSMDADAKILPILSELLVDLEELGTSSDVIVGLLRRLELSEDSRVLDLGCGKGAVATAIAEHFPVRVEGVDGYRPFLDFCRILASALGVQSRCSFKEGDIRDRLGRHEQNDVVLLLSVGPVSGDHERTMADLRTLVRPGGHIIIEDGFLAATGTGLPEWEGYTDHQETVRRLTAFGDRLVAEVVCSQEETQRENERNTTLIRDRAEKLKASYPDLEKEIDAYVAGQERETELLSRDLMCAYWMLQRNESVGQPLHLR